MTDLISRADAIEVVHKHFTDALDDLPTETDEDGDVIFKDTKSVNELLKHNKAISKELKALPSADAEWIPCSEKLPDNKTYVLTTIQAIDAVEVVRCKDCKNWRESHSEDEESYCYIDGRTTDSTDYCSWGERKEP